MRHYLVFAAVIFGLAGCSEMPRRIDTSQPTVLGTQLTYNYLNKSDSNYFKTAYDNAGNKKADIRNQILFELLGVVDDEFSGFERQLRSDRAYKDVVVKILSLALTGVASLSGETTANTLAAIDTGLKGANEAVDRSAFRDHAPELLINRMRTNRAIVATQIYDGMNKTVDAYPIQAGIRDVIRYFNEGSVTSALTSLAATTAQEAKTATESADKKKMQIQIQQ